MAPWPQLNSNHTNEFSEYAGGNITSGLPPARQLLEREQKPNYTRFSLDTGPIECGPENKYQFSDGGPHPWRCRPAIFKVISYKPYYWILIYYCRVKQVFR